MSIHSTVKAIAAVMLITVTAGAAGALTVLAFTVVWSVSPDAAVGGVLAAIVVGFVLAVRAVARSEG